MPREPEGVELLELGAIYGVKKEVKFRVWTPYSNSVDLLVIHKDGVLEKIPMAKADHEIYEITTIRDQNEIDYFYLLDGKKKRPDPLSNNQPDGVHSHTRTVMHTDFKWTDKGWKGIDIKDYIIYELHLGTFTQEGTFEAAIPYLGYLKDLGVTAIEMMPVGQFPGERNWGYDGTYIYAPQNSYGGHSGLKKLVNACHNKGLSVVLDVVYNHLGPEGNYLSDFGPYFCDRYRTPWGLAFNYDGPGSDRVRQFVVNNALYWLSQFHIDALRLDAIHGIFDFSPINIIEEISRKVHDYSRLSGRKVGIIAESDLNDPKVVTPKHNCGYGVDAQWSDDFHHSIHSFITGERRGFYCDFGKFNDILKSLANGFVYDGIYSRYRGRRHGAKSSHLSPDKFIVSLQNHDQVGNRADGLRLSKLVPPAALKMAAGLVILSPYIPLLFMGEEYGETNPFYYFISHGDSKLAQAVREGRKKEFEAFGWDYDTDPQDPNTFQNSKISLAKREEDPSKQCLFEHYRQLITLRKNHAALRRGSRLKMKVTAIKDKNILIIKRWEPNVEVLLLVYNLGRNESHIRFPENGSWIQIYNSSTSATEDGFEESGRYDGNTVSRDTKIELSSYSFTVFLKNKI
jgi:maltooligosyltrehalose trehalohydrolase